MTENIQEHWEKVYSKTTNENRGWYQKTPVISLEFLDITGAHTGKKIIDVGGGTSHLAELIDANQNELTVIDISKNAIEELKAHEKNHSRHINWIVGDITSIELPDKYDIWHDRAVFHFLIEEKQRKSYIDRLNQYLKSGGWLIMATFSPTGPEKCSGLPVERYSPASLSETLGENFVLKKSSEYTHITPSGKTQDYIYCLFQKK